MIDFNIVLFDDFETLDADDSEHFFHTEQQLNFFRRWLCENIAG